jgi:protoheme IX farnesyltransferase
LVFGFFMASTVTTLTPSSVSVATRWSDYWELTKPRLSLMNVVTAALGYFAAGPEISLTVFGSLLLGTALAAFGAGVLNMWWERDADAKMERTAGRPIPSGRVTPEAALVFGVVLCLGGVGLLAFGVNFTASLLTAATVLLYILAYTPLKRVTPWATELGSVPGALPPLIGWIAAGAGFSGLGWVLFAFLFAWQIPHFMAISWMSKEDYARGGFATLSVSDKSGRSVARKAFLWTILMVLVSFLPLFYGGFGFLFILSSSLLALYVLKMAWDFYLGADRQLSARRLFFATIAYLPAYLMVLVVDRFVI